MPKLGAQFFSRNILHPCHFVEKIFAVLLPFRCFFLQRIQERLPDSIVFFEVPVAGMFYDSFLNNFTIVGVMKCSPLLHWRITVASTVNFIQQALIIMLNQGMTGSRITGRSLIERVDKAAEESNRLVFSIQVIKTGRL